MKARLTSQGWWLAGIAHAGTLELKGDPKIKSLLVCVAPSLDVSFWQESGFTFSTIFAFMILRAGVYVCNIFQFHTIF
jgi:hypothetical protein